jgi:hypothetical protein
VAVDDENDLEQPDEQEAAVLPAREAMSLIAPDAAGSFPPGLGDATGAAPDPAQGAAVDARGAASAAESVSSDDRSEDVSDHEPRSQT